MSAWLIVLIVLAVLLAAYAAGTFFLYRNSFAARPGTDVLTEKKTNMWTPFLPQIRAGVEWIEKQPSRWMETRSFDGLMLKARYYPCGNSQKTILLFHGYRAVAQNDFSVAMPYYYSLGYNLLLVNQRAQGVSEGRYLGMGVLERRDVLSWVQKLNGAFGTQQKLVLGGLSMGASTVLMAAGSPLPANVCGIIADCGFTSPWDELEYVCRRSHMPVRLVMPALEFWSRRLGGYSLRGCSTLETLPHAKVPILFLHGTGDHFVPCSMSQAGYEACASPKRLVLVENAAHACSFLLDTERCKRELAEFLEHVTA